MKSQAMLIRSMFLICFFSLMTACGGGEKGSSAENADHGHSHE